MSGRVFIPIRDERGDLMASAGRANRWDGTEVGWSSNATRATF
jgi:hypothetical protein